MQKTIARIKAGDFQVRKSLSKERKNDDEFQDGEWQTAKSTNKKKVSNHNNHHTAADQIVNGGILSDSERSGSQRTSPTSSLRGGHRRNDRYAYSSSTRTDGRRRGKKIQWSFHEGISFAMIRNRTRSKSIQFSFFNSYSSHAEIYCIQSE